MKNSLNFFLFLFSCLSAQFFSSLASGQTLQEKKEALGQRLFFDPILSLSQSQSCATCHDPANAFIDKRENASQGAGSLGHDNLSMGDRNTPTLAYASQIPEFQQDKQGDYKGGMFWDGRETDLEGQAGGPPLNPIEMAMPSKEALKQRLYEDEHYQAAFKEIYGEQVFQSSDTFYEALKTSIAAFERTDFFSPFDSKYDRYLKGEYELSEKEELGMTLFFSEQFTNCSECHLLNKRPLSQNETFSDYRYHNIGVPENPELRRVNGQAADFKDSGLLNNPKVTDIEQRGKFKTPSLRNVAITGPYMHNGVFKELTTVIAFYNQYNSRKPQNKINPETQQTWAKPEIADNLALDLLKKGAALDQKRINAIAAFLETLTDRRYVKQ